MGGSDRVGVVGAGLRVQVDTEFVRVVGVPGPDRPGVEGEGAEGLAAQITAASSVGQSSSAGRPLGKAIRAVGIHSGRFFGARFW
ncbi:hypothetical protein SCYAM73S_08495 [Streptomyces cyaneofuscatus]